MSDPLQPEAARARGTPPTVPDDAPPPFSHPVRVRYRDVDAGGHVHHSHVLAYLEEARLAWWAAVTDRPLGLDTVDHILAEIQVRYRARIHWPDLLRVEVRVAVAGRAHLELEQRVWREPEGGEGPVAPAEAPGPAALPPTRELVAEGRVVLLPYDYGRSASVPVSEALRFRLEADAGHRLPRRRPRP